MPGYKTHFHLKKNVTDKTRIISLSKISTNLEIKIREDFMSLLFPSIWLEINKEHDQKSLVGGYYREWTIEGLLNTEEQLKSIKILTSQMEKADNENKQIVMMGGMNI